MKTRFPILFLFFLSACSLFEPRQAQKPTQSQPADFSAYGDIMEKLIDIYTAGRASDLSLILADGFVFEGDTLDSAGVHAARRTWDATVEKQVTAKMLSDTLRRVARENGNDIKTIADLADSAVVQWDYSLVLRDSSRIEGTSLFTLVRADNRFYLFRWNDRINPASSGTESWGRWKMENN